MTTAELARLVLAARRWPHRRRLLPETTRVTAHDLMLRLGRRASESELRAMLVELRERGAVALGEGGWSVCDWGVLEEVAR